MDRIVVAFLAAPIVFLILLALAFTYARYA